MAETLVKPSAIIRSEVVNLPPADQFAVRIYNPILLCFRLAPATNPREIYSKLRCGLSDALVEFPFFAGRIVKHDAARNRIQIQISIDDGVSFKYNDLTSSETQLPFLDFDDLEQAHFSPSKLDLSLSPADELFPTGSEPPALLLKANFIKGGLLLAVFPHHSTSDAAGLTPFLRSWAKYTAAAAKGSRIVPHRSFEILDRSPLFQVSNDITLEDCEPLVKVDDPTKGDRFKVQFFNTLSANRASNKFLNAIWYFSPERLRALKAAAQPTDKAESWVSTNDALCALLWRHITIARQLKDSAYRTTAALIPCNIRGRLSPKLNPDYAGNAIVMAHLSYPIKELYSTAPNCLQRVANGVRKAIDRVDERTVRDLYGVIDSSPTTGSVRYNFQPGSDFYLTTWASYDWYGCDWGNHMGRMVSLRLTYHYLSSGVTVMPRCRDGGLEVFMTPESEVLERLRLDETFTKFAELKSY